MEEEREKYVINEGGRKGKKQKILKKWVTIGDKQLTMSLCDMVTFDTLLDSFFNCFYRPVIMYFSKQYMLV